LRTYNTQHSEVIHTHIWGSKFEDHDRILTKIVAASACDM